MTKPNKSRAGQGRRPSKRTGKAGEGPETAAQTGVGQSGPGVVAAGVTETGVLSPISVEADLVNLGRLSARLWRSLSLEHGLDEMLAATMKLLWAAKGDVQLLHGDILKILVHSGFDRSFLDYFRKVTANDDSPCGRALRLRQPVIIEDIELDPGLADMVAVFHEANVRAIVSMPLYNGYGAPIGIISVHFTAPHRPTEEELFRVEQYVRQAGDFVQRFRFESDLRQREEQIRAILDATADAVISIDAIGKIIAFNRSAERIFGYTFGEVEGQSVKMLMTSADSERHDEYLARYYRTGEAHIIGRTRNMTARRKDGSSFPIQLSVRQVDHTGIFVGSVRDMSEQWALHEEVLRIASLEQQRIGQELHDGVQQELTGLGLLAQTLTEKLQQSGQTESHELSVRLAGGIEQAGRHVQHLARGMIPATVEPRGLMSALARLCDETRLNNGMACHFECTQPVFFDNRDVPSHLYRVVQEALSNAIKHARAKSIQVRLERGDHQATLDIIDDGVGIDATKQTSAGVGLRLMAHRCALVGCAFSVQPNEGGGTKICCTVPLRHDR